MKVFKPFFILFLLSFLVGCAGTYRSYIEMFQLALSSKKDAALPFSELNADNPDYLYVKWGDQPRAVMGLLFIEQAQLKWTSANNIILVTEQGRIVRSSGLADDLLYTSNTQADPLKRASFNNTSWGRMLDWRAGEYGYVVRSTFTEMDDQFLTFFGQQLPVKKVVETLTYETPSPYWRFDERWQNVFWFHATTGKLLQSHQQLAPGKPAYELVFISEVARQLRQAGVQVAGDAL